MKKATPMQPAKKTNPKTNNGNKKDTRSSDKDGCKAGSGKASQAEPNGDPPYKNPVSKPSLTND